MPIKDNFKLVVNTDLTQFMNEVNECLEQGYVLHGSHNIAFYQTGLTSGIFYSQTLVLPQYHSNNLINSVRSGGYKSQQQRKSRNK